MRMDLSSSLLAFRLAYIKMITKAWEEEKDNTIDITKTDGESDTPTAKWAPQSDYVKGLLACENILEHEGFIDFVPKDDKGIPAEFSWVVTVRLVNPVQGPHWAPKHLKARKVRGWVGPDDKFEIEIPKAPERDQQPAALASYYSIFPTLLGGGHIPVHLSSKAKGNSVETRSYTTSQGGSDNTLGIGGPEDLLAFGASMPNLIAYAWESEENFKDLMSPENNPLRQGQTAGDKTFLFQNPWGFNIEFKAGTTEWKSDHDGNWEWEALPKNVIWLNLPKPPPDKQKQAVALAAYNNSGPAYPYTCI